MNSKCQYTHFHVLQTPNSLTNADLCTVLQRMACSKGSWVGLKLRPRWSALSLNSHSTRWTTEVWSSSVYCSVFVGHNCFAFLLHCIINSILKALFALSDMTNWLPHYKMQHFILSHLQGNSILYKAICNPAYSMLLWRLTAPSLQDRHHHFCVPCQSCTADYSTQTTSDRKPLTCVSWLPSTVSVSTFSPSQMWKS